MRRLIPLLLPLLSCGGDSAPNDTASACPLTTDACMNEDNRAECLEVESTCDGTLVFLESCPLQFGCEA